MNNNFFRSELYNIFNIYQNTLIRAPKETIVWALRDFFAQDGIQYQYVQDSFGYAKDNEGDYTDLPLDAGIGNKLVTRLYIGETFRQNGSSQFLPSIIVKHGGAKSKPISFNRETGNVQWENYQIDDGYTTRNYRRPAYFLFAGGWAGTINIDVNARSQRQRDELAELICLFFTDIAHNALYKAGVVVMDVSLSAATEIDDRNDKIHKATVSLEIRTEWRRQIPIKNVIDIINFAIEIGRVDIPDAAPAPNLTIYTNTDINDTILYEIDPPDEPPVFPPPEDCNPIVVEDDSLLRIFLFGNSLV